MSTLVHIVPRFPPQIDGLGDYCSLLRSELDRRDGQIGRVVVGDPTWSSPISDATVTAISARTTEALGLALRDASTVVLHYVGYGYHSRGIPAWINQGVQRWKQASHNRRLVVVFHELWAFGPPWKTEFYTSLVQRWLCMRLHRLADASMTSVPINVRRLEAIQSGKTVFQPIPSNLPTGAPDRPPTATGRPIDIVAFGQEASRHKSLATHERFLRALNSRKRLGKVRIVGKRASSSGADARLLSSFLPADRIEIHPDVAPDEGARLIRASDLFVSFYPSAFLCKSGALMAALGNGCVPLLSETTNAEPLAEDRELVSCDGSETAIEQLLRKIDRGDIDRIAVAGRRWYDQHASWDAVVNSFLPLLHSAAGVSIG